MPQTATPTAPPAPGPRQAGHTSPTAALPPNWAAITTCWSCGAPGDEPHGRFCRDRFDDYELD